MSLSEEERKRQRRWLRERLAETDHIKVYQDATLALNFRTLINAYRDDERVRGWCSPRDHVRAARGEGEQDVVKRKGKRNSKDRCESRKPFMGAKLLLVDELSEPFLIA